MLTLGTTISSCPSPTSRTASIASFSQAISTSPRPRCTKVVVEPRAPVSSTGTFLYRRRTNSRARLITALLRARPGPGGQVVPARPAGGLGIGGDHRDARAHQVAPVVDSF